MLLYNIYKMEIAAEITAEKCVKFQKKMGRPRKYATIDEAHQADLAYAKQYYNTVTKRVCTECKIKVSNYKQHCITKAHKFNAEIFNEKKTQIKTQVGEFFNEYGVDPLI